MLTAAAPVQDLLAALLAATKAQQSAPLASRITTLSAPVTAGAPEKRGRGRPKLSEEEKAARQVARQEAKIAALRKEFERLAKKLVRAEAKLHKDDEFEDARAKPTDSEEDSEEDDSEEDDSEGEDA